MLNGYMHQDADGNGLSSVEFDNATDHVSVDWQEIRAEDAALLTKIYGGDDQLMDRGELEQIFTSGVVRASNGYRESETGEEIQDFVDLDLNPGFISKDMLARAFLAFDGDGAPGVSAGELKGATNWISDGDTGLVNDTEAQKIVTNFDKDGSGALDQTEMQTVVAGAGVLTTSAGKLVYTDGNIAGYQVNQQSAAAPNGAAAAWSDDLFQYVTKTPIPGADGSITELAYVGVLDEYKDAAEGTPERKFHDLVLAQSLAQNGFSDPSTFEGDLSPATVQGKVLNTTAITQQLDALTADPSFAASFDEKFKAKMNEVIGNYFVLNGGKIAPRTDQTPENALRVDGRTFALAAMEAAASGRSVDQDALNVLSSFLPPEQVDANIGEMAAQKTVDAIANMGLKDIDDANLAGGLEMAGVWLARTRGPVNWLGNLSNMTTGDWASLGRALKLTEAQGGDVKIAEQVVSRLTGSTRAGQLVSALGASGMWGTFGATAGVAGAILTYAADGPKRDLLLAGDPRENLGLAQNMLLVLSYSGSIAKAPLSLLGAFGVESAQTLFDQLNALPGFGRLATSWSTQFQPTFGQVADALVGVDLRDANAVKAALDTVDEATKAKWASDIGYDFKTLASNVAEATLDPAISSQTSPNLIMNSKDQALGFLFDMTGVDKAYKYFAEAESILSKYGYGQIKNIDGLRNALSSGGMLPNEIDVVVSDLTLSHHNRTALIPFKSRFDDDIRNSVYSWVENINFPQDVPTQQVYDDYIRPTVEVDAKLPPKINGVTRGGLFLKALGAGSDVAGGILGIVTGAMDIANANGNDAKTASGALGVISGGLGTAAGLAGLGLLPFAATPLFVLAGLAGLGALIATAFTEKEPSDQFAHALTEHLEPYGVLRPEARDTLRAWYLDNIITNENTNFY
ncbi:MAG: hypothetical protein HC850_14145 [Rhodomicrobium sp.]|nr:hypothetical protein [Rhodomicrobium sp.]